MQSGAPALLTQGPRTVWRDILFWVSAVLPDRLSYCFAWVSATFLRV